MAKADFKQTISLNEDITMQMRMAQELHEIISALNLVYPITESEAHEKNIPTKIVDGQLRIDGSALQKIVRLAHENQDLSIVPDILGIHVGLRNIWANKKKVVELRKRDTLPEHGGLTADAIREAMSTQQDAISPARIPPKPKNPNLAKTVAYERENLNIPNNPTESSDEETG